MQQNLLNKKSVPAGVGERTMVMALDRHEGEEIVLRFLNNNQSCRSSVQQVRLEEDMASQLLQLLADELHVPIGASI